MPKCCIPAIFSFFFVYSLCAQNQNGTEENKNRVTINLSGTANEARFVLFKDNLNKKVKDKFEIWSRTVEGDLIVTKVKYNGKFVILKTNSRRDRYANKLNRLIKSRCIIPVDSVKKASTVKEFIYPDDK